MQYRQVGKNDLWVSAVGFGCWAAGGTHWGPIDDRDVVAAIRTAIENGVNLIDTAPVYGRGHSEEIVGKAIEGRRKDVLISTKCGLLIDQGNRRSLAPSDIRAECEASLRRLNTDVIDIYFCHWPDRCGTPIEETVGALTDLCTQGKIRYFGLSNHGPDLIRRAAAAGPLACLQEHYSLLERTIEKDILPLASELGLGVLAYGPLGGGVLAGKYAHRPSFSAKDARNFFYRFYTEPGWTLAQRVLTVMRDIAGKRGVSVSHIAIAWVNQRPGITAALVGAKNPQQAFDNAQAGSIYLDPNEMSLLLDASSSVLKDRSGI